MTESNEIIEVNLLHLNWDITEAERLKRIFEIRAKYDKKTYEIISNPIEIEKYFREDDL